MILGKMKNTNCQIEHYFLHSDYQYIFVYLHLQIYIQRNSIFNLMHYNVFLGVFCSILSETISENSLDIFWFQFSVYKIFIEIIWKKVGMERDKKIFDTLKRNMTFCLYSKMKMADPTEWLFFIFPKMVIWSMNDISVKYTPNNRNNYQVTILTWAASAIDWKRCSHRKGHWPQIG